MKKNMKLIWLIIASTVIVPTCASLGLAASEVEHEAVTVQIMSSAFGSNAHTIGQAIESLTLKRHPWLRVSNAEGPGCAATTYNILENKADWKDRVGCGDTLGIYFASEGMAHFKKKYTNISDTLKGLFNFAFPTAGLIALDPEIKTEQDLAGKDVGLGRTGQAVWTLVQKLIIEDFTSPPLNDTRLVYLTPKQAVDALVDERVAAAGMLEVMTPPDFKTGYPAGPMVDLLGTGKKPHWIRFTDQTVAKGKEVIPKMWVKVPANTLSGDQPEALDLIVIPSFFAVHASFPEETAYELVKFVINNCGDLDKYHKLATPITIPENLSWGLSDEELHPGALRAYKEAGLR